MIFFFVNVKNMSSKTKMEFLDSVPAAKLRQYKKCLEARGRPSKECKPIRDEFNKFVKANKSASKAKSAPAPKVKPAPKAKAKPAPKAKPMTAAEKCKKTPIAKCEKPCKVFKTPNGKYCRKPKSAPKSPTKQTKKALSMMA